MKKSDYTVTTTGEFPKKVKTLKSQIKMVIRQARWLWKHRWDRNCRQKFRRMERELEK